MTVASLDAIDLLIDARWVIPAHPAGSVLERHSVAVHDGRILAVLPWSQAHAAYSARTVISLPVHALIPGLINLHAHGSMKLARATGATTAAEQTRPLAGRSAAAKISPQLAYDGTLLACAEMLRGGITCFGSVDYFPAESARAAIRLGMRLGMNLIVDDSPSSYAADADDYLAKGLELRDALREHPLLSFGIAPRNPCALGDSTLARVLTLAEELDLPVLMELHESRAAVQRCLAQHGARPLQRMQRLGLVGPNLIALRATEISQDEIALLAQNGCAVAVCPSADLRLVGALAPIAGLLNAGVTAGLATDTCFGRSRLDLLQEMRLAASAAAPESADRHASPLVEPGRALAMATIAGAHALRLDHKIGSIEAGKLADLAAIELSAPDMAGDADPLTQVVYCAGREHVSHVWVAGQAVLADKALRIDAKNDLENQFVLWQNTLSMETKA